MITQVGNAFRDAEVKDDAKAAANSLLAAFGATFQEIGDALQRAMRKSESDLEAEPAAEDVVEEAEKVVEDATAEVEDVAEEVAEEATEKDPPPADV